MSLHRKDLPEYNVCKPSPAQTALSTVRTQHALETVISGKTAVAQIGSDVLAQAERDYYVQHTDKLVRMYEQPHDPLVPLEFKIRRVPRAPLDDKVPIERSPPRKLTSGDKAKWQIPPCISNWKNARGYTIPLEMRLSADGRYFKEHSISGNFPLLAESLYQAEKNAREEINVRQDLRKKLRLKEAIKKEQEMREIAKQAKEERLKLLAEEQQLSSSEEEREQIRSKRTRELTRELRIERALKKHRNLTDRDLNEQIALGHSVAQAHAMDTRLFNQHEGLGAGFANADEYDVYDAPLFKDRSAAGIYRNIQTGSFDAHKVRPVEFEKPS